jgi:hypothetical protein
MLEAIWKTVRCTRPQSLQLTIGTASMACGCSVLVSSLDVPNHRLCGLCLSLPPIARVCVRVRVHKSQNKRASLKTQPPF